MTKQQYRDLHLFNGFDIAKLAGDSIFIDYRGPIGGYWPESAKISVVNITARFPFSKDLKVFYLRTTREKAEVLLEAQRWCVDHGLVGPKHGWERGPLNDWHPEGTLREAVELARERAEKFEWTNGGWLPK